MKDPPPYTSVTRAAFLHNLMHETYIHVGPERGVPIVVDTSMQLSLNGTMFSFRYHVLFFW